MSGHAGRCRGRLMSAAAALIAAGTIAGCGGTGESASPAGAGVEPVASVAPASTQTGTSSAHSPANPIPDASSSVVVDAAGSAAQVAAGASRSAAAAAAASAARQSATTAALTVSAQPPGQTPSAGAAPGTAAAGAEQSRLADAARAAAQAAAAAGSNPVDPAIPGDEGGPRCKGNEQYADEQPTGMRPDAAAVWQAADAAAATAGVTMCLADGKRSQVQQQQTFDEYVAQYGAAMAAQYVLPPEKSAHVQGTAVDVQPYAAYTWLEGTNGIFGLCRTYDNEVWHFEYDPGFVTGGCPARRPHPGG